MAAEILSRGSWRESGPKCDRHGEVESKYTPPPPPRAKSPSIVLNESTHIGRSTQALLSRRGNEDTNYTDTNYVTVIFIVFIGFLERLWITV